MNVRRTFKYRLYHNRRNRRLHQRLDIAGMIWNHMVALQRRTYRLSGKYISRYDMQRHLAKLRRRSPRFAFWQMVGSQAVQELAERQDRAYQRFFAYKQGKGPRHGRPRFKKVKHELHAEAGGLEIRGQEPDCHPGHDLQVQPLPAGRG